MEHVNAEILRTTIRAAAEILYAIADGKKVQYRYVAKGEDWVRNGSWKDFDAKSVEACSNVLTGYPNVEWRVAPKTVKIGDFEVPEPCWIPPEVGQQVWAIHPTNQVEPFTWYSSKACSQALEGGFVHLSEEAARQHYEAIKSLLKEK